MKKRLSVILPALNEAENIHPLIDAIKDALQDVHEIIVVDDDSPDGTAGIVENMIKTGKYPFLKLEVRQESHGLTNSIKRGIELASGDAIGWMDCDFSMPPKYLPVLLSLINAGHDVAVGSRFVLGGNWIGEKTDPANTPLAVALSRLMNLFTQICLDHRFKDYTSGFVVARKEIFDRIELKGDYGEYFIDFIYRVLKLNYRVVEIPYVWASRRGGYSKTGSSLGDYCKRGWKYIATTIRLLISWQNE
ncbi:MAG: glycosyltransferase [Candidatus Omnitrophota bacterium]|nr:MAG: glycosyltransferase [Candidatus Omnitrophota bacterium]